MPDIVHVIDDDEAVRDSLCALLAAKGYATQAHESSEHFLRDFAAADTLCVVADLRMPGMGALELQTELGNRAVDLPFVVVTGHGDVPSAVRALKSGAADFIEKPIDGMALIAAIDKAVALRRAARERSHAGQLAREKIAALSPRERDVLGHLVKGHPNKIIAYELGISPRTVENHRARLMVKMQVDSVAELVKLALAGGFLAESGS